MYEHQPMGLPSHETLTQLACDDPQAFEELRRALIEHFITCAPESMQTTLRQLQFRVDGIRHRSRSPLGAVVKTQSLMWDTFLRLNHELQRLVQLNDGNDRLGDQEIHLNGHPSRSARIIEFQPRLPIRTG
jgi:hypothetical protein